MCVNGYPTIDTSGVVAQIHSDSTNELVAM